VYIVDGVVRVVDSSATQSPSQLQAWLGIDPDSILDITVVHPDSAAARYGSRARGGAILIRTKPDSMQAKPAERAMLPPKIR
jgi:outer membrane receptor for ferrienterochelin and colicin